jgi:hypothetical protein
MIKNLHRSGLATFLILVASAILLLTDRKRSTGGAGSSRTWKVG